MSPNTTVADTYRQEVRRIVEHTGTAADRKDASAAAVAILVEQAKRGTIQVDLEAYFAEQVKHADELDGAKADTILAKATDTGALTLFDVDLDVIVTLGKGKRKPWNFVTLDDLVEMNTIRFENTRRVQAAYRNDWLPKFYAVAEVLDAYLTFGDAYRAGGFPPQTLLDEVA